MKQRRLKTLKVKNKWVGYLFCVLMIFSAVCGNMIVYADEKPTFILDETVNSDGTITAILSFTPDVSAAGTIKLGYDTDVLELKSAVQGSLNVQMVNINPDEEGIVSLNFLNAQGVVGGNTELAVINFSLKNNKFNENTIYAESFKLYDIDSKLISDNTTVDLKYSLNTKNAPQNIDIEESSKKTNEHTDVSRQESDTSNNSEKQESSKSGGMQSHTSDIPQTDDSGSVESATVSENTSDGDESSLNDNPGLTVSEAQTEKSDGISSDESEQSYSSSTVSHDTAEAEDEVSSDNLPQESGIASLNPEKGGDNTISSDSETEQNNSTYTNGENTVIVITAVIIIALAAGVFVIITVRKQKSKK